MDGGKEPTIDNKKATAPMTDEDEVPSLLDESSSSSDEDEEATTAMTDGDDTVVKRLKMSDTEDKLVSAKEEKLRELKMKEAKVAQQKRIKEIFLKYLGAAEKGCQRFGCTNSWCASNPTRDTTMGFDENTDAKAKKTKLAKLCLQCAVKHCRDKKDDSRTFCVPVHPLSRGELEGLYEESKTDAFRAVTHRIGPFFADLDSIAASFFKRDDEGRVVACTDEEPSFDLGEWNHVHDLLTDDDTPCANAFHGGLERLGQTIARQSSLLAKGLHRNTLRAFLILFEVRAFMMPEGHDTLRNISRAITNLPETNRTTLATWLSQYDLEHLENILGMLQQYITVRWLTNNYVDANMGYVAKVVSIVHDANMMKETKGEKALDYTFFYNDAINEEMKVRDDYERWREGDFAFCLCPFMLDPAAKARVMQIDSRVQMQIQFRQTIMASFLQPVQQSPYLVLHIHRQNIIQDTLQQIQMVDRDDFKKPLKIKFRGEQGIDEGGVQKEFFQLLIAELFDPKFGMFVYDEETFQFWFNKDSMDTIEFELIGTLLGLAIYNGVILDIHFPSVVYKKLMKGKPNLNDLCEARPELGKGLKHLLEFDGDVKETYCRTFSQSYDVYGETQVVEFKEGGSEIDLTGENREEYVQLFVEHVLEKSVERQYQAFERGFACVCDGEPLQMFRFEELELLICGSPELDFEAFEANCRYEDGFEVDNPTIRHFWSVVHEMKLEDKKKLLCFTTGSDRVPIKGLGKMKFTISKNGPDSDRLPTSHTCFNHLLLPEYGTREKMRKFLLLAIANSKGFGLM